MSETETNSQRDGRWYIVAKHFKDADWKSDSSLPNLYGPVGSEGEAVEIVAALATPEFRKAWNMVYADWYADPVPAAAQSIAALITETFKRIGATR